MVDRLEHGSKLHLGLVVAGIALVAALASATAQESDRAEPPTALAATATPTVAPTADGPPESNTSTRATDSIPATPGPDPVPVEERPAPPVRGRTVIHGVGDVNFDPGYIPNLATNGHGFAFEGLDGLFEDDDLTVINLECSPSDLGQRVPKAFNFRCDPDALPVARTNGVEVANLANNHVLDYGVDAMLDGRDNVERARIAPVGVGADLTQATAPALIDVNGWTVAVLGMGGVVPADWWLATAEAPGMASGDDIDQMVAAVQAADEVADLVVVSIHWMWELELTPRPDDRQRAEAMIAAGADVIFGHHPHRLGELEMIDGRPVFWTLGNFIWPRFSDAGATTAVARVVVEADGRIDGCLIPAFITVSGRPELTGPPPCGPGSPGEVAAGRSGGGGAQNRLS